MFERPYDSIEGGRANPEEPTTCQMHCAFENEALRGMVETPAQQEALRSMEATSELARAAVEGQITL